MYSVINSQTDLELVTLDEAKRQCRISWDIDDDELNSLIKTCSQLAQDYTHKLLTLGSVTAEIEEYKSVVILPWGNVTTIDSVELDGEVAVEDEDYTFSTVTQKIKFSTTYSNAVITYSCGYSTVPEKVKQGVLVMLSTLFNNHDDIIVGMSLTVENMPLASTRLLDSVRYYVT